MILLLCYVCPNTTIFRGVHDMRLAGRLAAVDGNTADGPSGVVRQVPHNSQCHSGAGQISHMGPATESKRSSTLHCPVAHEFRVIYYYCDRVRVRVHVRVRVACSCGVEENLN